MTDMTGPTRPDLSCDDVRDRAASFVLGALNADEADAVRAHLASCADPHAEMAELGSVLSVLAEVVPVVEPPAALKGRIMAAAAVDLEARGQGAVAAGPAAETATPAGPETASTAAAEAEAEAETGSPAVPTAFPTAAERQERAADRAGIADWAMRIAAVLAIALLGTWGLLLQNQLDSARSYEQNVAAVLDVAGQPGSLTAVLTPEGGDGPAGLAAVASDGTVRIAMRDLPATTGNQVYEAWVIGSDGVPKPLGGFRVGETGIAYFEGGGLPTQEGIVLALTLEPGPGATAPSSTPVSLGTAVSAG
jgi:anti-sigma-K factor RskA